MTRKTKVIVQLENKLKEHEMYANYWMAMATTGATCNRHVTRNNVRLTDDELIEDALDTARRHIHLHRETHEALMDCYPD